MHVLFRRKLLFSGFRVPARFFSGSFIEIAQRNGVHSLLGKVLPNQGGFDRVLSDAGMTIDELSDGLARCSFIVSKDLSNSYGTLHGGAISLLVDVLGTLALLTSNNAESGGVTVEMSSSFVKAAKVGSKVEAVGRVLRIGKNLGFTEVEIREVNSGKLLASGRHTKFFPGK